LVPKLVHVTHLPFLGVSLELFFTTFSLEIHQLCEKKKNFVLISVFSKMSFHSYSELHLGSHCEDKMHHIPESTFPFFVEDINALSYISWEREIDDLVHSFHLRHSKYYFLTLCISSFVGHAREWWKYRQSRVEKGRKSPIQNWSELRACMRRTFISPSFDFDREIEKKKE